MPVRQLPVVTKPSADETYAALQNGEHDEELTPEKKVPRSGELFYYQTSSSSSCQSNDSSASENSDPENNEEQSQTDRQEDDDD